MYGYLKPLAFATAIALAAPALAEETTEPANDTVGAGVLDLGQPADGPQLGQRYSKQQYGDWDLACIKTEAETDPCSLFQVMMDEQGNPLAEISLFRLENSGPAVAGATVVVPLETLLQAQLTLSVDGGAGKRYHYAFCNQVGCVSQIGLTAQDIESFKKGGQATVTIVPALAPDQKVSATMSLIGFTDGYDAVDVVQN